MPLPFNLKLLNFAPRAGVSTNLGSTSTDKNGNKSGLTSFNANLYSATLEATPDVSYKAPILNELYKNCNLQGRKTLANMMENTVFRFQFPLSLSANVHISEQPVIIPLEGKNIEYNNNEFNKVDGQLSLPFSAGVSVPIRPYTESGSIKKIKTERNVALLTKNPALLVSLGGQYNENGIISTYEEIKEDGLYVRKGWVLLNNKEPNLEFPDGVDKMSTPPIDFYNSETTRKRSIITGIVADRREALANLKDKIAQVNKTAKYCGLNTQIIIQEFTNYYQEMQFADKKSIEAYKHDVSAKIKYLTDEKESLQSQLKPLHHRDNDIPAETVVNYYEKIFGESPSSNYFKSDNAARPAYSPDVTDILSHNAKINEQIYQVEAKIDELKESLKDENLHNIPEVQKNKADFENKMQQYVSEQMNGLVYIDGIEKTAEQAKNPSAQKLEFTEEDLDVLTHYNQIYVGNETKEVKLQKRNANKTAKQVLENFKEYTENGFVTPEDKEYLENTSKEKLDPERVKEIKNHSKSCKKDYDEWERTYNQQVRNNWLHNCGTKIKEMINDAGGVPYVKLDGGVTVNLRSKVMNGIVNGMLNQGIKDPDGKEAFENYVDSFAGTKLIDYAPVELQYTGISGYGEIGAGYAHPYFDISGGVVFRGSNQRVFQNEKIDGTHIAPFMELTLRKIGTSKKANYNVDAMAPVNVNNSELNDAKLLSKTTAECSVTARVEVVDKKPQFLFGVTISG